MEDMYSRPDYRLSPQQERAINDVISPQKQEDLYLSITGRKHIITPKKVFMK